MIGAIQTGHRIGLGRAAREGVGMAGPLSGVRVVELGQVIAGPFCGQLLGDYGADVIKVEPPGTGDVLRQWGLKDPSSDSLWWSVAARNKRSVTIDLRTPEGQQLVRDLVARADIVVENFRPGTLERWGLGWEQLSAVRPELIMVRISGFGQTGPYAQRAGYASVGEAMGGLRALTGYPDRPPVRVGVSIGDSLTGMFGALGALAALEARRRTGRGQVVDASIFESVLGVTESLVVEWQARGARRERTGPTLPGIAPSNVYPTRDGEVLIGANQDSVFRRLCALMDRPDLVTDPRFADHQARGRHMAEIDEVVAAWTRPQPSSALLARLHEAGVPAGLLYEPKDMLDDPHYAARRSIVTVPDERHGELAMLDVVPKFGATPAEVRWTGPALGADTDAVLTGVLGLSAEQVEQLRDRGVIGSPPDPTEEDDR
jgi:crotonobetainyl-CoA:carnitine CoA-transferase CaiB-like acyl-CoA transferase